MEDSESEEDRLLKSKCLSTINVCLLTLLAHAAKIRRLYDVANVLVSVGLIEKLQLSNSRKPVFRWKPRSAAANACISKICPISAVEQSFHQFVKPFFSNVAIAESKLVPQSTIAEETDIIQTTQSCESDGLIDGSDCQSDGNSCDFKRKQPDQDASEVSMSDGNTSIKPVSTDQQTASADKRLARTANGKYLLQMGANNKPIHPRTILRQQQEQVNLYMEQYVREYVAYLTAHPTLPDATSTTEACASVRKDRDDNLLLVKDHVKVLQSESPQSVAKIATGRAVTNPIAAVPMAASFQAVEPEAEPTPRPLAPSVGKSHAKAVVAFLASSTPTHD